MPKIILVTSGKGGTGKSTVTCLLGRALAHKGKNVLLLELDSGLRGLDLMTGVSDRVIYDLSDVLTGRCRPAMAINTIDTTAGNLHLIAAPMDRYFTANEKRLEMLIKSLAPCYDFLILDAAAGLGPALDAAAAVCDLALIVSTPDPVSLRDAAQTSTVLPCEARLVINRFHTRVLKTVFPHIDAMIDTAGVRLISVIPEDAVLAAAAASGHEPGIKSAARGESEDLALRILGERVYLNTDRLA